MGHTADALVIGAGAAGLRAAAALERAGKRVIVLEARDRIGGRCWSDQRMPGLSLELGAAWIHGSNPANPVFFAARQLGLRLVPSNTGQLGGALAIWDAQGRRLTPEAQQRLDGLTRAAESFVFAADAPAHESVELRLRRWTRTQMLAQDDARALRYKFVSNIVHEYADDLARTSPLVAFDDHTHDDFGIDDVMVLGGYDEVLRPAPGLDIRLGHAATRIAHDARGVRVTTLTGEFDAPVCVLTLPLGVLKAGAVAFDPVLPAELRAAITRLGVGVINKLALRFERAFWPDDADWFGHITGEPEVFGQWVNLHRHSGAPVLIAEHAGEFGRRCELLDDAALVGAAMSALRGMFGAQIPALLDYARTRWGADPYAHGSYSYMAVGAAFADRAAFAQPLDGRLFFAGEHTHTRYPGTLHGAWLSGERAAGQILAL